MLFYEIRYCLHQQLHQILFIKNVLTLWHPELTRCTETAKGSREALDAVHALLEKGLGQREGTEPGAEALGDRKDDWPDVEGSDGRWEDRVRRGVRDGEGRVRSRHDAVQKLAGISGPDSTWSYTWFELTTSCSHKHTSPHMTRAPVLEISTLIIVNLFSQRNPTQLTTWTHSVPRYCLPLSCYYFAVKVCFLFRPTCKRRAEGLPLSKTPNHAGCVLPNGELTSNRRRTRKTPTTD